MTIWKNNVVACILLLSPMQAHLHRRQFPATIEAQLPASGDAALPDYGNKHGNHARLLKGRFSAIVTLLGSDLIVMEQSPSACRIVRLSTEFQTRRVRDAMDCAEIIGISPRRSYLLRSAQILDGKYMGDTPSPTSPKRDLVTASASADAIEFPLQPVPVPQMQQYSRFDPTWEDSTHVVYMRKRL